MGAAEKIQKYYITVEEYFEIEQQSEIRHELGLPNSHRYSTKNNRVSRFN
jgi:hypothetical protein